MNSEDWEIKIFFQLQFAVRSNKISKKLAEEVEHLLEGEKEIVLLYNNTRDKYMGWFYKENWFTPKYAKKDRFSKTRKELLLKLIKAGVEGAKEEMKLRIKKKTW